MLSIDLLTTDWSLLFVSATLILVSYLPNSKRSFRPRALKWANGASTWLSRLIAPWKCSFNGREVMQDCYNQVNKNQEPRLLPGLLGNQIMLPSSWIPWLMAQPETSLSTREFQANLLNVRTSMLHKDIVDNPVHAKILQRKLNSQQNVLANDIMAEVEHAFEQQWGLDTEEFRTIQLTPTLCRIVAAATNRVLVGQELCRNADYLDDAIQFVQSVLASGTLLNLFPMWMKPLLGKLFTVPTRYRFARCAKYLRPLFDAVKVQYSEDPSSLPELYSTWSVDDAMTRPVHDYDKSSDMLSLRVLVLNLVMGHNVIVVSTTTLIDAISAPAEQNCAAKLLAESQSVDSAFGATWNRGRFLKLIRLDSAIRESMRISSFITRVLNRRVMAPGGIMLPDGTHVPAGSTVCIGGYGIQHDPTIYHDPMTYHHDRFLERRPARLTPPQAMKGAGEPLQSLTEEASAVNMDSEAAGSVEESYFLTKAAASLDASHLMWGLGKHACPGRQFAVDMVKMIVSHAMTKYEIEPMKERPDNTWIEYHMLPPKQVTLSVRRRKESKAEP